MYKDREKVAVIEEMVEERQREEDGVQRQRKGCSYRGNGRGETKRRRWRTKTEKRLQLQRKW